MNTPPPTDQLLKSTPDAARMLDIGERTLARLTAAGEIPVVRIGRKAIRYDVRDLLAFIERNKNKEAGSDTEPKHARC